MALFGHDWTQESDVGPNRPPFSTRDDWLDKMNPSVGDVVKKSHFLRTRR